VLNLGCILCKPLNMDDEKNIVRVFKCICGTCFCSILKYYVFICNFYNIVSRLLKEILLLSQFKLHNIAVYIIDYKEIADKADPHKL
jgi:hypothetical protein